MIPLEQNILKSILRTDLASFIAKVFSTINSGIVYEHNWHIDLIADYLMAAQKGEIHNLIINIPPRSLKSICVSVAWPAFILGHDPTKRIIVASYAQNLSIKHSLDCRIVMTSPWYRELFPGTILSTTHNQKSKYLTSENGFRMATSIGGMVTGEGGDVLIIDDPHNPSHIHSNKRRGNVIEWYEQTFSTRLNNKRTGSMILVMQRLHKEDLSGYLLEDSSGWKLLKIPIVNEEGEIFHPSRYSNETLSKIKDEMGHSNFAAQYMQEPVELDNGMLSLNDISFYDPLESSSDYFIQSWDTAIKNSEISDYSVCTTWGIRGNNYYLFHVQRVKLLFPALKNEVIKLAARFEPRVILIEDHASGQSLIQDLRSDGITNLIPIKHKIDKVTRFASIIGMFQSGSVKLPRNTPWLKAFIDELTKFPHDTHDDIVDSVSQFLCYMKKTERIEHIVRVREI